MLFFLNKNRVFEKKIIKYIWYIYRWNLLYKMGFVIFLDVNVSV